MVRHAAKRGAVVTVMWAQVGAAVPTSPWEMVVHSGPLIKVVLAVLVILSLVSWAVMWSKWRQLREVAAAGRAFMREFERASSLEEVSEVARRTKSSPYTRVFTRALNFFAEMKPGALREATGSPLSGSQVEALRLVLDSETAGERDRFGQYIPWLAVIGTSSPLIGLLGTVLGVIDAFVGIATSGSGNLSAVAPGVAEALIATAAALAVAIPAIFGYNIFASQVNRLESELENFGSELIALMVREGRI
jgi:biopolymer transport protein TolQ